MSESRQAILAALLKCPKCPKCQALRLATRNGLVCFDCRGKIEPIASKTRSDLRRMFPGQFVY